MELTKDVLISFQGLTGYPGLAHVRLYEEPGKRPVAIVGQLKDAPGTMINNGIEGVAEAVRSQLLDDGQEFDLVTYLPGAHPFSLVTFQADDAGGDPFDPANYTGQTVITDGTRKAEIMAAPKAGAFRDPSWKRIDDIKTMVGVRVEEWHRDDYTAATVFGAEGRRVREEIAAAAKAQTEGWSDALGSA